MPCKEKKTSEFEESIHLYANMVLWSMIATQDS